MLTTLMSEQLAAVDSPLGEASDQDGSLDIDMLSPPIVDNQLSADLSTDSVSLTNSMSLYQLPHVNPHMSAANHNKV